MLFLQVSPSSLASLNHIHPSMFIPAVSRPLLVLPIFNMYACSYVLCNARICVCFSLSEGVFHAVRAFARFFRLFFFFKNKSLVTPCPLRTGCQEILDGEWSALPFFFLQAGDLSIRY